MDINLNERYSRHELLSQIRPEGQNRLRKSHVLVIGSGGLGSACLLYLVSAGIGTITLFDGDEVELSNLQRQILHLESSVGQKKVDSAKALLKQLNSEVKLNIIDRFFSPSDIAFVQEADVVVDCTDKLHIRLIINQICVVTKTPLISGSAVRMEGQLMHFPMRTHDPCYACLAGQLQEPKITSREVGVFAPAVGTIGTLQATEVIKSLLDLVPKKISIMLFDALSLDMVHFKLIKNPECTVCNNSLE